MKVSALGRCRGNGKLYTRIAIQDKSLISISAKSYIGRAEVPAFVIEDEPNIYILVVADFKSTQRVVVSGTNSDGSRSSTNLTINPAHYSIASKINGVINKQHCAEIRNVDTFVSAQEALLTCDGFIPTEGGLLVRGFVFNDSKACVSEVVVFDSNGMIAGRSSALIEVRRPTSSSNGTSCSPSIYSVAIPHHLKGICIAALDGEGAYIDAIAMYKAKPYKELVKGEIERLADAASDWHYADWFAGHRLSASTARTQRATTIDDGPTFSVIVPLYKTPLNFFRDMADSVLRQTYSKWELVLVNSTPEDSELKKLVDSYERADQRVRVVELERNLGITENTNAGIEIASSDFLCFFDHDDVLEPDILFEYAKAIESDPKIDLLYCDEDKLFPNGTFGAPTFKPDFSLDMVRDNNYVCHLLTVRRSAYDQIEPSGPELDGAQDHAMVLKIAELGGHIHHVSKILYHWRISETSTAGNSDSKPYATEAGILAVQQHLDRLGIAAKVSNAHGRAFRYRVDYDLSQDVLVSVVVPVERDGAGLSSLYASLSKCAHEAWELVLVCSEDKQDSIAAELKRLASGRIRVISTSKQYSPASWFNVGAERALGECMVFMREGVRPGSDEFLTVLAGFAMRQDVGVVGTMTCDDGEVIRQASLAIVDNQIIRLSSGTHRSVPGYLFYPLTVRNVSAVDGACFAVSRDSYERVGCFDERLLTGYESVDYSFASAKEGLKVVYTPECWAFDSRPESRCSGSSGNQRLHDFFYLHEKWHEVFSSYDPYFNVNFSRRPEKAALYQLDQHAAYHV